MKIKTFLPLFFLLSFFTTVAFLATATEPNPKTKPTFDRANSSSPELILAHEAAGLLPAEQTAQYLAYALFQPHKLPAQFVGEKPWDGTIPLLQLQQLMKKIEPSPLRSELTSLINDGSCDRSSGFTNTVTTTHFLIEYTTPVALSINDYAISLEQSWATVIDSFGWAAPPSLRPDGRYHVIVDDLDSVYSDYPSRLYGLVTMTGTHTSLVGDNPNTLTWVETDAVVSCMLLNSDFTNFPSPPQEALDATTAHELIHAIQFGYGLNTTTNDMDLLLLEAVATMMEDELWDNVDDNYNYLWPTFDSCMGEYSSVPYAYWVILRAMTEQYGSTVPGGTEQIWQRFHEEMSQENLYNLDALNQAFVSHGSTTLATQFHNQAIALHYNKSCDANYSYPYCLEEGPAYKAFAGAIPFDGILTGSNDSFGRSLQNNYATSWVQLSPSIKYNVILQNNGSSGALKATLVCDTGSGFSMNVLATNLLPGETSVLNDYNGSGCNSVSAVITNLEQTAANPASCSLTEYTISTNSVPPTPTRANNVYLMPVVMKEIPTATPSPTPSPSPTPAPLPLTNGNFESGTANWNYSSAAGWPIIVQATSLPNLPPHSGNWVAWLGGANNEISSIWQTIQVPTTQYYLHYWHWRASDDACSYDFGKLIINDTVVADPLNLCITTNTNAWVERVVNLSTYAGKSIKLEFKVTTDASYNSNLFIDDLTFSNSATISNPITPSFSVPNSTASKAEVWQKTTP